MERRGEKAGGGACTWAGWKFVQVIADCEPPSARVNASFVTYTKQINMEAVWGGGRWLEGKVAQAGCQGARVYLLPRYKKMTRG